MSLLGIDYGRRFIGLALGHTETKIALPLETYDRTRGDVFERIAHIVAEEFITVGVIGSHTPSNIFKDESHDLNDFIGKLKAVCPSLLLHTGNERFSSKEARARMKECKTSDDHAVAAMLILQSFFDSKP